MAHLFENVTLQRNVDRFCRLEETIYNFLSFTLLWIPCLHPNSLFFIDLLCTSIKILEQNS